MERGDGLRGPGHLNRGFVFGFYFVVTLLALVLHYFFVGGSLAVPGEWGEGGPGKPEWMGILGGLGIAFIVIVVDILCERYFDWAREFSSGIRGLVGKLSSGDILLFSLLSGVGEELLFRGVFLPLWGLVVSSVLFGIVHWGGVREKMWIWPIFSGILGFGFGILTLWSGSLLGAIVGHFTINFVNFHRISR